MKNSRLSGQVVIQIAGTAGADEDDSSPALRDLLAATVRSFLASSERASASA